MEAPSLDLVAVSRTPDGSQPVTKKPLTQRETLKPPSHFTSVQWSADGTTLFTTSSEARLSTYVVPANLLEPRDSNEPLTLTPQGTLVLADNLGPIAPCPYFNLHNPSTQLVLTTSKEQPIQLYHPFQPPAEASSAEHQRPLASYPQINPLTEAYAPITALIWPAAPSSPTSQFYTGSYTSEIAIFDISRPGASSSPIAKVPTVWKTARKTRVGLRGVISALSVQAPDSSYGAGGYGLLAAGTWARAVGVYDLNRSGACVTSWSTAYNLSKWAPSTGCENDAGTDCGTGQGVTQILWSPCGQYMIINERCTSALLVYDVRETYQLVARLIGRRIGDGNALQRLQADVYPGSPSTGGFEVWSGTGDGGLVVWEGVGLKEGDIKPTWEKKGITDGFASAVSGAVMHRSGAVVATVSGSWTFADDDSDSDSSDFESESEFDSDSSEDEDEKDDDAEKKNGDSSDPDSDSDSDSESDSSEDEDEKDDDGEKKQEKDESKGKDRDESTSMDISDTSSDTSSDSSSLSSSSEGSDHPRNRIVVKETSLKIWSIRAANPGSGAVAGEAQIVQQQEEEEEVVDEWGRVRRCDTSYGEDGGSHSSLPPRSPTPVPMD